MSGVYTEQDLINGCCKGKIKYQEGLYRQFYSFAMSVCLRYAPNREDALEVLNDSFMKVFDNIKKFDQTRPFKSWFRRILVNTALDHYRANKKYRLQVEYEAEMMDVPVDLEMDRSLETDEILDLFEQLPEIYRITFNLYEVEGYNHEEIAGLLDIAPGTSRSNLSRAKKMLKALYFNNKKKQCHEAV
jgi:RNA polymerase sigma factor (sigma-70 family)